MTAGESITFQVAQALEACGIPFLLRARSRAITTAFRVRPGTQTSCSRPSTPPGRNLRSNWAKTSSSTRNYLSRRIPAHCARASAQEEGVQGGAVLLSQDPHDQSRFERRRAVQLHDRRLWLPSPEDVVVTKLRWARGKDKDDVRDVMAVQRDKLDWGYIEQWCRRHGTLALMEEIRRSLPAR